VNIALIAHDRRKELMIQFCIAYCGILSKHDICATDLTGKLVSEATGLKITRFLSSARDSVQHISARVAYDEIDLVIFLRDPAASKRDEADFYSLLKQCDSHSIPVATNIATAEVLIMGLFRGDLGWRDIINPKTR